ncbi:hypothetical protein LA080_006039 [Diaporthe eres]|nr:hypothetical protein LA080_006039 [Diaporthe eres]
MLAVSLIELLQIISTPPSPLSNDLIRNSRSSFQSIKRLRSKIPWMLRLSLSCEMLNARLDAACKAISPLYFGSSWRQSSTCKRGNVVAVLMWPASLSHVGIPDPLFTGSKDTPTA